MYIAADVLLLGLGVPASEGVDSQWQVEAFLAAWTKGAC